VCNVDSDEDEAGACKTALSFGAVAAATEGELLDTLLLLLEPWE
jgi:hypothetical protein